MLVVARSDRDGLGVAVNALGYAGCLVARTDAAFDALKADPAAVLRAAAVGAPPA